MLPGADGFELCGLIRQGGRTPVIMLTARDQKSRQARGSGAWGGRLRDQAVRFRGTAGTDSSRAAACAPDGRPASRSARRVIDFRAFKAMRGHRELRLSRREFDLLSYLAEREGAVVPATNCCGKSGDFQTNRRRARSITRSGAFGERSSGSAQSPAHPYRPRRRLLSDACASRVRRRTGSKPSNWCSARDSAVLRHNLPL